MAGGQAQKSVHNSGGRLVTFSGDQKRQKHRAHNYDLINLKFFYIDITKLDQAWRAYPLSIFFISMMLQSDRSFFSYPGKQGILNYCNAIEYNG